MASALRGAHVGTLNTKGEQPSIFDVVSQESLMKALKPAAGHLLKVDMKILKKRDYFSFWQ